MAKRFVADSCFWFALFEPRDQYHRAATSLQEQLTVHDLIVPWPTLYEALNTRLVRRPDRLARFKAIIERPSTSIVEDRSYRTDSLRIVLGPDPAYLQPGRPCHSFNDRGPLIEAPCPAYVQSKGLPRRMQPPRDNSPERVACRAHSGWLHRAAPHNSMLCGMRDFAM